MDSRCWVTVPPVRAITVPACRIRHVVRPTQYAENKHRLSCVITDARFTTLGYSCSAVTYLLSSQIQFAFHFCFQSMFTLTTGREVCNVQCNLLTSVIKRTFLLSWKSQLWVGKIDYSISWFWSKIAISMSFEKIVTALKKVLAAKTFFISFQTWHLKWN